MNSDSRDPPRVGDPYGNPPDENRRNINFLQAKLTVTQRIDPTLKNLAEQDFILEQIRKAADPMSVKIAEKKRELAKRRARGHEHGPPTIDSDSQYSSSSHIDSSDDEEMVQCAHEIALARANNRKLQRDRDDCRRRSGSGPMPNSPPVRSLGIE